MLLNITEKPLKYATIPGRSKGNIKMNTGCCKSMYVCMYLFFFIKDKRHSLSIQISFYFSNILINCLKTVGIHMKMRSLTVLHGL